MWISHRKEIRKLTFRAQALRLSESRNCGLCVSQYQNQAQNLPVQRTFNSSLRLRDVENQQEVGEQTSGLRREMFTENIES